MDLVRKPASSSSSGEITPDTQTIYGAKTFADDVVISGSLTPSGGIVGKTDGTFVSSADKIGYIIRSGNATGRTMTTGSTVIFSNDTTGGIAGGLVLPAGVWMVFFKVKFEGSNNNSSYYSAYISGSPTSPVLPSNVISGAWDYGFDAQHVTALSGIIANGSIGPLMIANASSQTIYGAVFQGGGTANTSRGELVAIRIA